MIRKFINIFSLPLNKIQTLTLADHDRAPALHISDLVLYCVLPWALCFSYSCMLAAPHTDESPFCVWTNTCSLLKLGQCPRTSHGSSVKSPLKCSLLREAFLFSIQLAYFIFLMDLLLIFFMDIWNCISLLLLIFCPNRMQASQGFGLLSLLLASLCPELGWVHETIE